MKLYEQDTEMVKQMEEHFGMVTLIKKIKSLPEVDKLIIRNRIILSIIYNTTKTKEQAIEETKELLLNIEKWEK